VYSNIIKFVTVCGPYVQKIECAKHATRCLRSNLEKFVSDKPLYKGKGGLPKLNILRITTCVRCAIIMRSNDSQCSRNDSVKKLSSDIRNAGRHVLGLRDMCSTDFCKHTLTSLHDQNENIVDTEEEDDDVDMTNLSIGKMWGKPGR